MLKIGILLKYFEKLENWELRIIENIKNDSNLELILLIKDDNEPQTTKNRELSFGNWLLKKQINIEENRYLIDKQTIDKDFILKFLKTIPIIEFKPKIFDKVPTISNGDILRIKNYKLDVIIKLVPEILSGGIFKAAKYGIWELFHSDMSIRKGGFPGFWEVLLRKPIVEVSLIQLDFDVTGEGKIIDKAFYNPNYRSFVVNNNLVKESSVSLISKNLKRLLDANQIALKEEINLNLSNKPIGLSNTGKYLFGFYKNYLINKFKNINNKERRDQQWTLFIGEGSFMESDLASLRPIKIPDDEFWADPFLFIHKDEYYVFFENYSYITKRGKICCGKVKNDKLTYIVDVLDLDYHLSYPFIFEDDDQIFMMPETGQNKRLEVYRCLSFPNQWELYSTAFEGESIQDTTLYIDKDQQKWLFLNKVSSPNMDRTSELYIYKIDSLKLDEIIPHKQNPVIIDSRVARNGGAIFNYQNKIYRPSQSNTDGIYGKALNINQIQKLTIEEYQEKLIRKVESDFQKNLVSIHHLHQMDGMFVFDAAYKNNNN